MIKTRTTMAGITTTTHLSKMGKTWQNPPKIPKPRSNRKPQHPNDWPNIEPNGPPTTISRKFPRITRGDCPICPRRFLKEYWNIYPSNNA